MPTHPAIKLCAGQLTPDDVWLPECQDCKRHTAPILKHNDWIIPPEFDNQCPEKIKEKTKD